MSGRPTEINKRSRGYKKSKYKAKKIKCDSCDGFKSPQADQCRDCFARRKFSKNVFITRDEVFKTKLREIVIEAAKKYGDDTLLRVMERKGGKV